MNRFLLSNSLMLLLAGQAMNLSADSIDKIVGDADMKIDDVKTYSVAEDADVTNYRWLPAVGKNRPSEQMLAALSPKVRWCVYYALVIGILIGLIMQSGGLNAPGFAYANF